MGKKKWSIDPDDVSMGWNGSASTVVHSKNWDRRNQIRSYEVTLRHIPTGVSITKRTAEKMLSRQEWKREMETFQAELMKDLEDKVAKHLRIPGR